MEGGHYMDLQKLQGVGDRRTSCRSVGGRRFSAGVLNSDGSELG